MIYGMYMNQLAQTPLVMLYTPTEKAIIEALNKEDHTGQQSDL